MRLRPRLHSHLTASLALVVALAIVGTASGLPIDPLDPPPIENGPPPRFHRPADGFKWSVPSRFGKLDARGIVDYHWNSREFLKSDRYGVERYDPTYVHPSTFPANFDGCPTASERDKDSEGEPTDNTYVWTVADPAEPDGSKTTSDRRCTFSHAWTAEGAYSVELAILNPDGTPFEGRAEPYEQTIRIKDFLVVSIGDSYASGEGNPDKPAVVGYIGPLRPEKYVNQPAVWQDRRCHRSAHAGPAQAAIALERADPHSSVTFLSFACSGATINTPYFQGGPALDPHRPGRRDMPVGTGVLGPYLGPEPFDEILRPIDVEDYDPAHQVPSQITQLKDTVGHRRIDALVVSGGGNDLGFGPIVTVCILYGNCPEHEVSGRQGEGFRPLHQRLGQDLAALHPQYDALDAALESAENDFDLDRVYVTEYPDPTRNDSGALCGEMLEDVIPAAMFPLLSLAAVLESRHAPIPWYHIDSAEAEWASNEVLGGLNGAVAAAAERHGWRYVDGISALFAGDGFGHGYCARDSWIRRASDSIALQGPWYDGLAGGAPDTGRTKGLLHPTARGHKAYAERILAHLLPDLLGESAEPAAVPRFSTSLQALGSTARQGDNGWLTGRCADSQCTSDFAVTAVEATHAAGIDRAGLTVNGVAGCTAAGVTCTTSTSTTNGEVTTYRWEFRFAADGVYRLEFTAAGADGGSGNFSTEVKVDLHDPTAVTATPTAAAEPTAGWYRTPVDVTLGGTDAPGGSGIAAVEYDLDGGGFVRGGAGEEIRVASDGVHSLVVRAVDWAGRKSAVQTITIRINRTFANGKIAYESAVTGNSEIFVMAADGSRQTNLTNDPAGAGQPADTDPAWSPDGSRIAFSRQGEGHVNVWVMNADGSGKTNLTPGSATSGQANTGIEPTWSPDGTKIAFNSGGNVWVMNADGSAKINLTGAHGASGAFGNAPAWSPDGAKIAYGRQGDIWVMNAAGSGPTQLTTSSRGELRPDWSPDGTRIAYDRDGRIWVMNADGNAQTQLPPIGSRPAWSPDGSKIVFDSNGNGAPNGHDIFVMNADGTGITRLNTPVPRADLDPSWQSVALPAATIGNATVVEGDAGTVAAEFVVELSEPSAHTVSVDYETRDGSAKTPGDYQAVNGTLTFAPGETRRTLTVDVLGDTLFEDSETFVVTLTGSTNVEITDDEAVGIVTNDDDPTSEPPTDTVAPTLSLPADMTVEATGPGGARVEYTPSGSDDGGLAPTVICAPAPGSVFPFGETTVECTAIDAAGNQATGSFTVRVVDTVAPTLSIPGDIDEQFPQISFEATGPEGAIGAFSVLATDIVDPAPTVTCTPASGSLFPLGRTLVNCTATDAAGNQATGSFEVVVWEPIRPPLVRVADDLAEIVAANPDTPLADKVEDAIAKLEAALQKLAETPPDRQGALGELEGAVGELESAVKDGLLSPSEGTALMGRIVSSEEGPGGARELAEEALRQALERGGDGEQITEAHRALAEGDAKRAAGEFKDAIAKYKDALSKAEDA